MAGSTPIYGFPYPESSDLVANYPALGQDLAEDIEGVIAAIPPGGLSMVNPTSIANSGGTASASGGEVTYTGVSSISLNGIFTSTYQNYRIIINQIGSSGSATDVLARLRAAGTDATGNNYVRAGHFNTNTSSGNIYADGQNNEIIGSTASFIGINSLDVLQPNTASPTGFSVLSVGVGSTSSGGLYLVGCHTLSTAYDGITVYPAAGTLTGKIRVYGYKNS